MLNGAARTFKVPSSALESTAVQCHVTWLLGVTHSNADEETVKVPEAR